MPIGELRKGFQYDPNDPLYGGTKAKLFLGNIDDKSGLSLSASTPNLVTAITMKTGKVLNYFEGFRNPIMPVTEAVEMPSKQTGYKHMMDFFVFTNTQLWKNELKNIGDGKYFALIQNNQDNAQSFEIFGAINGMELQPGVLNNKNESSGAYHLVLSSRAGQEEMLLPQTLFSTDFATTLALVESYAAIPTVTVISDLALQVAGGDAETITGTKFHGGGSASAIESVKWVNQNTGAKTTQTSVTVASDTSLTFTSVALTAGIYKLEVITTRGTAISTQTATAS